MTLLLRVHKTKQEDDDEIHQGRNVKCIREMLGKKQEALARELGRGWSQKRVSLLESAKEVDDVSLIRIAEILEVPRHILRYGTRNMLRALLHTIPDKESMDKILTVPKAAAVAKLVDAVEKLSNCQTELGGLYEKAIDSIRSVEHIARVIKGDNHQNDFRGSITKY